MGDCSLGGDDNQQMGCTSNSLIPKENPRNIARKYQLELAKIALEENVIVVLGTGCGKTLISILLMCDMAHLIKKPQKNVCVFLAPTVVLVKQQAESIEKYTDFKVGMFCGDAKPLKSHAAWESELEQYEVLVMTPESLLRKLCHCFLRMEAIALLIFDECHYAQSGSNHPYAEIMKVFYDTKVAKVPRIFGMTASAIHGKGASINSLQASLHAKVYTVKDKTQLEAVVVSPVVQVYHYSSIENLSSSHNKCLDKLEEIKRQCASLLCRTGDDPSKVQNAKKILQRLHNNILFAYTSLGLWGALQSCRILLNGDGSERNELIDVRGNSWDDFNQNEYLTKVVSLLDVECMEDAAEGMVDTLSNNLLREPFFSQKVLRLVGILSKSNFRSRPDMKCIIFVNRIIIARSLAYILGKIKILSAWKCNYLVGVHSKRMSRKNMHQILEEFRSGELNLLVATKVGEEGLDIQTCCLVIRFDLPETLASFIQSRGRARMAQSEYAFLVDSKSEKEMNLVDSFRKDEDLMNLDIRDRKPNGVIADITEDVYTVCSTGATISCQTSISLLYHYCSKLPHDEFFNPKPDIFNVDDTEGIICHIILPSNAPIHHIVGGRQSSKEAAKKDACLRACKELHQVGALTDFLLPEQDGVKKEDSLDVPDSDSSEDEDSPVALQEMVVPATLKEPWYDEGNHVCLKSYFIRFNPKPHDRQYKEFGLFVKESLPFEAERMSIDLHLARGRSVLTDLVPGGVAEFTDEEMLLALNFQEMCLKVVLDRSEFTGGHVPLNKDKVFESISSTFYLLLPVIIEESDSSICVDWRVIRKCLSSPVFAPLGHSLDLQITQDNHLQLADGPASVNDIRNSLVYVAHKKSFFFVSEILQDKNGYSLFNSDTSHIDHFSERFEIHLAHPEQPLLQVKQLFGLRNLLHDRKKEISESSELEEYFFEFPPELCEIKIIGFSKDIGSSLSLLPSIMHRLKNLLVAIELKDILSNSFPEGSVVTAERVLEALTTEKCNERFSLERLEVLGDAFLKFAVGRHLFLKHETFDEGQLTRRRSNQVNNSNLCKLALKNNLQGYIRDQVFDPSQFFALGRPCSVICTKEMESSIHCNSAINPRNGMDNRQVICSRNHHWLTKKTIADVVEALVGAYIVDSGFQAASAFLRWFGIQVEFEASQVCHAWTASSRFMSMADRISVPDIEGILGHRFAHKGLVLQALIHPSYNQHGGGCYQRLEFLGDAVLDYLITSYLYTAFPDLKPGQLTDLRSSFVNNSSFARVAASALHKFIICENKSLCDAIDKFVDFIRKPTLEKLLLEEPPCPKALGDLVESCIGSILLDAGFDLNHVWKVMLSFLSPIMRFSNLQLSPIRELLELCQHHGWGVEFVPSKRNKGYMVEAMVDGKNIASATYRSTKGAKRMAAQQATEILKAKGYRLKAKSLEEVLKTLHKSEARLVGYDEMPLSLYSSSMLPGVATSNLEDNFKQCVNPASLELAFGNFTLNGVSNDCTSLEPSVNEVPAIISCEKKSSRSSFSSSKRPLLRNQHARDEIHSIDSDVHDGPKKASAKLQLNEICVKNCWKHPLYECCEEEGPSHMKVFTYKVVVVIEDAEDVILECVGRPQAKKKVAADEAAEAALWYLKKAGFIK